MHSAFIRTMCCLMGFGLIQGCLSASVVSFDFNATLQTGPLSGTTFSGTGSYDTKGSTGTGLEFQNLITLEFTLLGARYTKADLVQGGQAALQDGVLVYFTADFIPPPPCGGQVEIAFGFGGPGVIGYIKPPSIGTGMFTITPAVEAYAGYLNNRTGMSESVNVPSPFDSTDDTILISTGGSSAPHDTGVLRLRNETTTPVVIDRGLTVKTDRMVFRIWDRFLPVTLAPGHNLVLAETANGNFDSSDSGLAKFPIVTGTLNRGAVFFVFRDNNGVLLGNRDKGNSSETAPYDSIGRIPLSATCKDLPLIVTGPSICTTK